MIKDRVGQVFGRLQVVKLSHVRHGANWECLCLCGNIVISRGDALVGGRTISCGCYNLDRITKHKHTRTPEFRSWQNMKDRCLNLKAKNYKDYGGRGIGVCPTWIASFNNFLNDMGYKPTSLHSLDRVDNDSGYEPSNCRWATSKVQQWNRRVTPWVIFNGERIPLPKLANDFGIPTNTLWNRVFRLGWTVDRSLFLGGALSS